MRTRTRFLENDCAGTFHCYSWSNSNPNVKADYGYYNVMATTRNELITDDTSRRWFRTATGTRRQVIKPVSHWKYSGEVLSPDFVWHTGPNNSQCTTPLCFILFNVGPNPMTRTNSSDPIGGLMEHAVMTTGAADSGHYDRWRYSRPSMATRCNLSVFFLELRDIKRMFSLIPTKHLSRYIKVGRFFQVRPIKSWKDALTYVNGQHLNYNFGWKPFVNDVRKAFKSYTNFEQRLKWFLTNADKDIRRHNRVPSDGSYESVISPVGTAGFSMRRSCSMTVERASTFEYLYSLPSLGLNEMRVRAWLDAFGLNLNPSTIWELIPWSFVVDWFVNVGGALQSVENDWTQPWIDLQQACYSRKIHGTSVLSLRLDSYAADGWVPAAKCTFTHYVRAPGIPRFSYATDPLDADKIRLGGSLILSRLL